MEDTTVWAVLRIQLFIWTIFQDYSPLWSVEFKVSLYSQFNQGTHVVRQLLFFCVLFFLSRHSLAVISPQLHFNRNVKKKKVCFCSEILDSQGKWNLNAPAGEGKGWNTSIPFSIIYPISDSGFLTMISSGCENLSHVFRMNKNGSSVCFPFVVWIIPFPLSQNPITVKQSS